jgi:hypothetical protein
MSCYISILTDWMFRESRHSELEQAIECIEPALTALHHMVKQSLQVLDIIDFKAINT